MLVIGGLVSYTAPNGEVWTFAPSFARVNDLGSPQATVDLYAGLFGESPAEDARYVLTCLCEQEDPSPLLGWLDEDRMPHVGAMPQELQVLLAQHLMQFSILGASDEVLRLPEYQSILAMKFNEPSLWEATSWMEYMTRVKEQANG